MKKDNDIKSSGWYVSRRDLDIYLRSIFPKNVVNQHLAKYILLEKPNFADSLKKDGLKKGEVDASYAKICEVFPGAIEEWSFSRMMKTLEKRGLISRKKRGIKTITKSLFYFKMTDLEHDFSLKNLQVESSISASEIPDSCKSKDSHNDHKTNELPLLTDSSCKSVPVEMQVISSKSATIYNNKEDNNKEDYNKKEDLSFSLINPIPCGLNKNKGKGKNKSMVDDFDGADETKNEKENNMDIRTAITPKVKVAKVKAEKKPNATVVKKEFDYPTSKVMAEGWKNPITLIRAFAKAVKSKYKNVNMGSDKLPYESNTEPASKAIDWVRDEVYKNNSASEAEIRSVLENWVEWYVSTKIDSVYRFKRDVLNLQAFFDSRAQYYETKDSNELLVLRTRQRKTVVTSSKQSIMTSFDRMRNLAEDSRRSPVMAFIKLALLNKGIVLTCLYLDNKKMTENTVDLVTKVLMEQKGMSAGRDYIRNVYSETWRYMSKEISKGMVPYSQWEITFGKIWEDITMLEKKEPISNESKLVSEFILQLVAPKM
jgi:hypothetical protein